MIRQLKFAQHNLTESVIRRFWKALTLTFPAMCVNDGISINYKNYQLTSLKLEPIVEKLTVCKSANVACPVFQFDYEPQNSTPHHVSAITLTKMHTGNVLSFFDPKGRGSSRKTEEIAFLYLLVQKISERTGKRTKLLMYDGKNLQQNDDIGLCQLFSLFYLYEYVNEVTAMPPKSLDTFVDPNKMVKYIHKKRGGFNERTLYAFWNAYFRVGYNM